MSTAGTGHGFAGSRARCTTEGRNEVRRAFWILNAAFHVVHVLQNAALGWCLCCTVRTVSGRVPICVCTRSSLRGLHSACPMSQSPQASQVDQLRRHSIHERFTSAICPHRITCCRPIRSLFPHQCRSKPQTRRKSRTQPSRKCSSKRRTPGVPRSPSDVSAGPKCARLCRVCQVILDRLRTLS